MAKCHLGKVKIELRLAVGLCLAAVSGWSVDYPQSTCDMMQGGHKGLTLPLAGVALCQCVSESLQIEADCCRSNSWCLKGSLQISSNRSLRINLLLHVLSKSLQIQAVHCRSIIAGVPVEKP